MERMHQRAQTNPGWRKSDIPSPNGIRPYGSRLTRSLNAGEPLLRASSSCLCLLRASACAEKRKTAQPKVTINSMHRRTRGQADRRYQFFALELVARPFRQFVLFQILRINSIGTNWDDTTLRKALPKWDFCDIERKTSYK